MADDADVIPGSVQAGAGVQSPAMLAARVNMLQKQVQEQRKEIQSLVDTLMDLRSSQAIQGEDLKTLTRTNTSTNNSSNRRMSSVMSAVTKMNQWKTGARRSIFAPPPPTTTTTSTTTKVTPQSPKSTAAKPDTSGQNNFTNLMRSGSEEELEANEAAIAGKIRELLANRELEEGNQEEGNKILTWLQQSLSPFVIHYPDSTARHLLHLIITGCSVLQLAEVTLLAVHCRVDTTRAEMFVSFFLFSNAMWFLECGLNFSTANFFGYELYDEAHHLDVIRRKYLHRWFLFDFIVGFPFDLVALLFTSVAFNFLQCATPFTSEPYTWLHWLRALHVFRVPTLFRQRNPLDPRPKFVQFTWGVFTAYTVLHMCACAYMYITPDLDQTSEGEDTIITYSQALVWAFQTIVHGLYNQPKSNVSRLYALAVAVCGTLAVLTVGGLLAAFFVNRDPFHEVMSDRKRRLAALMSRNLVPWSVQKAVFAVYPSLAKLSLKDYSDVVEQLPGSIGEEILKHVKMTLIHSVPLFSELSDAAIEALALVCQPEIVPPQVTLMTYGQAATTMYFVSHGVVEIRVLDPTTGKGAATGNLGDGSWFGEHALLSQGKGTLFVRTVTACDLFRIEQHDFQYLAGLFPELQDMGEMEKTSPDPTINVVETVALMRRPIAEGGLTFLKGRNDFVASDAVTWVLETLYKGQGKRRDFAVQMLRWWETRGFLEAVDVDGTVNPFTDSSRHYRLNPKGTVISRHVNSGHAQSVITHPSASPKKAKKRPRRSPSMGGGLPHATSNVGLPARDSSTSDVEQEVSRSDDETIPVVEIRSSD